MKRSILIVSILIFSLSFSSNAQNKKGYFFGGVESTFNSYVKDSILGFDPEEKTGLHTWINLGYAYDNFRTGLQYEIFEPPIIGFKRELKGHRLTTGFIEYSKRGNEIRLGNVYDQFGSGLIFRTYEERALALDNSLLGGRVQVTAIPHVILKAVCGKPRRYLGYSNSFVAGVDGELMVSDILFPSSEATFILGGSFVNRRDNTKIDPNAEKDFSSDVDEIALSHPNLNMFAGRISYIQGPVTLNLEYVNRGKDYFLDPISIESKVDYKKGNAILAGIGLNYFGFGLNGEFRRIDRMFFPTEAKSFNLPAMLNYIPSLTKQHKYTLQSLRLHVVDEMLGEIGGQVDIFGDISYGFLEDNPLSIAINASYYNSLEENNNLFKEVNVDLEKYFGNRVKGIFSFSYQDAYDKVDGGKIESKTIVTDWLFKLSRKNSIRTEFQHQWNGSEFDKKWAMLLVEYGFSPYFTFSLSDYVSYDTTRDKVHYYNVAGSFTKSNFRVQLSYGRNKAGLQCVGGVCRLIPSYTGLGVNLNWSF